MAHRYALLHWWITTLETVAFKTKWRSRPKSKNEILSKIQLFFFSKNKKTSLTFCLVSRCLLKPQWSLEPPLLLSAGCFTEWCWWSVFVPLPLTWVQLIQEACCDGKCCRPPQLCLSGSLLTFEPRKDDCHLIGGTRTGTDTVLQYWPGNPFKRLSWVCLFDSEPGFHAGNNLIIFWFLE